jgi:hypothetical protein
MAQYRPVPSTYLSPLERPRCPKCVSPDVAFKSGDRVVRLRPSNLRMPEMRTRSLADYRKRPDAIKRERLAFQRTGRVAIGRIKWNSHRAM